MCLGTLKLTTAAVGDTTKDVNLCVPNSVCDLSASAADATLIATDVDNYQPTLFVEYQAPDPTNVAAGNVDWVPRDINSIKCTAPTTDSVAL